MLYAANPYSRWSENIHILLWILGIAALYYIDDDEGISRRTPGDVMGQGGLLYIFEWW